MATAHEAFDGSRKLSPDEIARVTGFVAVNEFPDFVKPDGFLSPEFLEEMNRFIAKYDEGNVVSSFFQEGDEVKFGIFIKQQ